MNDTPRTDHEAFNVYAEYAGHKKLMESDLVDAEFCRQLERELNAAKRELQDAVKRMEAISREELWRIYSEFDSPMVYDCINAVRARLISAAKGEQP